MRYFIVFFIMFALCACGNSGSSKVADKELPELAGEKVSKAEFLKTWSEQGVDNFSFDEEGYLVYTINRNEVQADPDWVAQQQYELASNVDSIKGCRLVKENGVEFGRYVP
jgi:hypothetical protein